MYGLSLSYLELLCTVLRVTFDPDLHASTRVRAWHTLIEATRVDDRTRVHAVSFLRPLAKGMRAGLGVVDLVLLQCMTEDLAPGKEFTGELWAAKVAARPFVRRLAYHFERSGARTNRLDRPEWYVRYLLRAARGISNWVDADVQPAVARSGYVVDVFAHVARELVRHAHTHVRRRSAALISSAESLNATASAYAVGDLVLRGEFGYGVRYNVGAEDEPWPCLMDVFNVRE
jgi:hypothetical protein